MHFKGAQEERHVCVLATTMLKSCYINVVFNTRLHMLTTTTLLSTPKGRDSSSQRALVIAYQTICGAFKKFLL